MANKPFTIRGGGCSHFHQLESRDLTSFGRSEFLVEVVAEIEIEQLLDVATWGPQPRVKRGDLIHVMREDNGFFATFLCWQSVAAYPQLRLLTLVRDDAAPAAPMTGDSVRAEFVLGQGWSAIIEGETVASGLPSEAAAREKLAELAAGAVA